MEVCNLIGIFQPKRIAYREFINLEQYLLLVKEGNHNLSTEVIVCEIEELLKIEQFERPLSPEEDERYLYLFQVVLKRMTDIGIGNFAN